SSRRRHTRSKRDWSSVVCSSDLGQLDEVGDLDAEHLALVAQQLADLVLLAELEVIGHIAGVDRDVVVGLVVHEVVQIAVLIAVGHVAALDERLGELGSGVVAGLDDRAGDDVLGLGADKGSALAGLDVLELNDLKNLAVLLKGHAIAKFACRNHKEFLHQFSISCSRISKNIVPNCALFGKGFRQKTGKKPGSDAVLHRMAVDLAQSAGVFGLGAGALADDHRSKPALGEQLHEGGGFGAELGLGKGPVALFAPGRELDAGKVDVELPRPLVPQRLPHPVKDGGVVRFGADAAQGAGVQMAKVDAGDDALVHPAQGQHLVQIAQLADLAQRLGAEEIGRASCRATGGSTGRESQRTI